MYILYWNDITGDHNVVTPERSTAFTIYTSVNGDMLDTFTCYLGNQEMDPAQSYLKPLTNNDIPIPKT